MKVLKFGGTSVANAVNINKVKEIVAATADERIYVVVSALGGITDILLRAADLAANRNEAYVELAREIESRHLETAKELIPITSQSAVLSKIKSDYNSLETLLEGAYSIGETTPRLLDKIVSYGELLSSFIISEYFKKEGLDAKLKNGRELIRTDDTYGKAVVDIEKTIQLCNDYQAVTNERVTVVPGFVSSTDDGNATTLGRGGSDYSAAIIAAALKADVLEIWTDVSGMYTANVGPYFL